MSIKTKEDELKFLFEEATSSQTQEPNPKLFHKISKLLDTEKKLLNFFITYLIKNFQSTNFNKIFLTFELIEYTTCHNGENLHLEYHQKTFLKQINNCLINQDFPTQIKQQIIYIVLLWKMMFSQDKIKFKNFPWYVDQLKNKGIPFPDFHSSKYLENINSDSVTSDRIQDLNLEIFTIRQKKLLKDLEIVRENITLENQLLNQKDGAMSKEIMERIYQMEAKIIQLPEKLSDQKEDFLYKYSVALLYDIEQTKIRYNKLLSKNEIPNFESKVSQIVKKEIQKQSINFPPKKNNNTNNQQYFQTPHSQIQSKNDLHEIPSKSDVNDPFNNLDNVYHNQTQSEFNPTSKMDTQQRQNQMTTKSPELNLLNMQTITESRDVVQEIEQNKVKFGPEKDSDFNIDLTNQKQTGFQQHFQQFPQNSMEMQNQNQLALPAYQNQTSQSNYKPQNKITFEKIEKQEMKKQEKMEYDPFAGINDLNFEVDAKEEKQGKEKIYFEQLIVLIMDSAHKKTRMNENHKLLSNKQKEEIKKAFDFFDVSGSGIIDASNLKVVLRSLGFDSHKEEILKILKEINFEEENISIESKIDFQRFLNIIIYKMGEKETNENIVKAFRLFEDVEKRVEKNENQKEQQEFITKKSLMKVVESLEEEITEEEVEELIIRAINKNDLLKMGEKFNDQENKIDFDSPKYFVTQNDFIKILNEDFIDKKRYKVNK